MKVRRGIICSFLRSPDLSKLSMILKARTTSNFGRGLPTTKGAEVALLTSLVGSRHSVPSTPTESGKDTPSDRYAYMSPRRHRILTIVPQKPPVAPKLVLDNANYHSIDISKTPPGFAEVDVKLNDNGEIVDSLLVAGHVGARVCDSGDQTFGAEGIRDTAKPVVAWWIFAREEEDNVPTKRGWGRR